jgi:hypothetical protein
MPTLMISHAEIDSEIATTWYDLLEKVFPTFEYKYSSNPNDPSFSSYSAFADQIQQWITESDYCLTLQTSNSAVRPWIVWEAGMARALRKGIYVILFGIEPGNLKNPLDSHPHYDGTNPVDVRKIIRGISTGTATRYDESSLEAALAAYQTKLKEKRYVYEFRQVDYEKHICLELTYAQRQTLIQNAKVPDDANIRGEFGCLGIFGYDPQTLSITWGELVGKLQRDEDERPWPGSAVAWTKMLGRTLRKAISRQWTPDDPEGLPLYWEVRGTSGISYRPAIAQQKVAGGKTTFWIAFTQLPPELTARPPGALGTLFHYIDFARMLRWGVLKNPRFRDFFEGNLTGQALCQKKADFLDTLLNIRIEFQNRGLEKEQILSAVSVEQQDAVQKILDDYHQIVRQLEPENEPNLETIIDSGPKLLSVNARFFKILEEAIANRLAKEFAIPVSPR